MNAQAAPFSGNEPGFMAQSESKCLHRTAPVPGGGMRRRGSLISGISTGAQTRTIGRPGFYSGGGSKCSHQTAPVPGGGMRRRGSCVFGISTGAQTRTIGRPGVTPRSGGRRLTGPRRARQGLFYRHAQFFEHFSASIASTSISTHSASCGWTTSMT